MSNPTPKQIAALRLLAAEHRDITASRFAHLMWPDSPGHQRRINGPWGLGPTAGINRAAGSFLSRLRKAGYVREIDHGDDGFSTWVISSAGRNVLAILDDELT